MIYKLVISDRDFNVLDEFQDRANNISFDYSRIGGCGGMNFRIPSRYCRNILISTGFNVKLYRRNPSTNDYDLWYQGKIESTLPDIRGESENLSVSAMGYQAELRDIHIDASYTSTEISVIVKSLLDNYILPNTNITYDAGDITATSFTPDSIIFNGNAQDAIRTLADVTGTREWGVDRNRKLFFKSRSSTVGFYYPLSGKIINFSGDDSSKDIVNRVVFIGGGDPPFTATYNDTISQLKWKRRDRVIQNSAVTTSAVATQFADSIFDEFSEIVRKANIDLLEERQIESTIPIPLFRMIPELTRYGEMKYGEFLYSGYIDYQVNRVMYTIDDSGSLRMGIQLGQLRPNISESISQLAYQLDQMRQQNL